MVYLVLAAVAFAVPLAALSKRSKANALAAKKAHAKEYHGDRFN